MSFGFHFAHWRWRFKTFSVSYFSKLQIFASDSFLELTEYSREEILGRNCRCATKLFNVMFSKYENEKKKIIIYSAVPIPYSKAPFGLHVPHSCLRLPFSFFFFPLDQLLLHCSWNMNSTLRQSYSIKRVKSVAEIIFLLFSVFKGILKNE